MNETRSTALLIATIQGEVGTVNALLNAGNENDTPNKDGMTALMTAAGAGHTEIVKMLLNFRASINIRNNNGWSALMWAAENGHAELVHLLLDHGAEIDCLSKNGMSALTRATLKGFEEVVELLLHRGAGVDFLSSDKRSALMIASESGYTNIVRMLLRKNSSVDLKSSSGRTALIIASCHNHTDIILDLIHANAHIDLVSNNGWTALMWAAFSGSCDAVKLLLQWKAKVSVVDKLGNTAHSLAKGKGYEDIAYSLSLYEDLSSIEQNGEGNSPPTCLVESTREKKYVPVSTKSADITKKNSMAMNHNPKIAKPIQETGQWISNTVESVPKAELPKVEQISTAVSPIPNGVKQISKAVESNRQSNATPSLLSLPRNAAKVSLPSAVEQDMWDDIYTKEQQLKATATERMNHISPVFIDSALVQSHLYRHNLNNSQHTNAVGSQSTNTLNSMNTIRESSDNAVSSKNHIGTISSTTTQSYAEDIPGNVQQTDASQAHDPLAESSELFFLQAEKQILVTNERELEAIRSTNEYLKLKNAQLLDVIQELESSKSELLDKLSSMQHRDKAIDTFHGMDSGVSGVTISGQNRREVDSKHKTVSGPKNDISLMQTNVQNGRSEVGSKHNAVTRSKNNLVSLQMESQKGGELGLEQVKVSKLSGSMAEINRMRKEKGKVSETKNDKFAAASVRPSSKGNHKKGKLVEEGCKLQLEDSNPHPKDSNSLDTISQARGFLWYLFCS